MLAKKSRSGATLILVATGRTTVTRSVSRRVRRDDVAGEHGARTAKKSLPLTLIGSGRALRPLQCATASAAEFASDSSLEGTGTTHQFFEWRDNGNSSWYRAALSGNDRCPALTRPNSDVTPGQGGVARCGQCPLSNGRHVIGPSICRKPLVFNANTQTKAFVAPGRESMGPLNLYEVYRAIARMRASAG